MFPISSKHYNSTKRYILTYSLLCHPLPLVLKVISPAKHSMLIQKPIKRENREKEIE